MSKLSNRINADSAERFEDLGPQTKAKVLADSAPVLATPAIAAGAAVTAGFVAGYAVEEAGDS